MPTIWGIRDGASLRPYQKFHDALLDVPQGARLRIKIEEDRNGRFSALYHVMLGMIAKEITQGPGPMVLAIDDLKRWVKLKKGYYDTVELPKPLPTGETHAIEYRSTAFSKMGEGEFHKFATDSCELIRAELAPWIAEGEAWPEIKSMLDSILPEQAA